MNNWKVCLHLGNTELGDFGVLPVVLDWKEAAQHWRFTKESVQQGKWATLLASVKTVDVPFPFQIQRTIYWSHSFSPIDLLQGKATNRAEGDNPKQGGTWWYGSAACSLSLIFSQAIQEDGPLTPWYSCFTHDRRLHRDIMLKLPSEKWRRTPISL